MNLKTLIAILLLGSSLPARAAGSDGPSTEIDLRAAYCIGVEEKAVAMFDGPAVASRDRLAPRSATNAHDRLQRLDQYFALRGASVDKSATEVARKWGFDDLQFVTTDPLEKACQKKCAMKLSGVEDSKQCLKSCDVERYSRIWSCADLRWLPE